jgi:hypothetical protein
MAQYIFSAQTLKTLHPDSTVYKGNESGKLPGPKDNPTVLPIDLLRRFKHTFLIRTPQKSVPSYWKCVQEKAAGFEYFDGAEAGYAELQILYDWISNPESTFNKAKEDESQNWPGQVQAQANPLPLVDASVLLAEPDKVLSEYCSALGIPFDPSMLSWESGPVAEFASWGTYHKGAENSTGFNKETPVEKEAEEASRRPRSHSGAGLSDTSSSGADTETEQDSRKAKTKKQMPPEVLETIRYVPSRHECNIVCSLILSTAQTWTLTIICLHTDPSRRSQRKRNERLNVTGSIKSNVSHFARLHHQSRSFCSEK